MMRCFGFFSFLLFSFTVNAQLTVKQFLGSAVNADEVKSLDEQVNFLNQKSYRLSPLQRLELRVQTPELEKDFNQYGVRLTPANPWELRNNNRYFSSLASSISLEKEMILKEALLERYQCVIYFAYLAQLKALLAEHENLLNAQLGVLEKQSGSSFFDPDEYLDLQVDLLDHTVEIEESDIELMTMFNQVETLARRQIPDSINWQLVSLIPINRIRMVVDSLTSNSISNLVQRYHQQQIDLAKSEYKLESTNFNLGFIQSEFDNRRYDQGRTPINLSFGVTIPLTNPNKGDMAKRKLEIINATHELEEEKTEEDFKNDLLQQKITRIIARHDNLVQKISGLGNSALANTLSTLKNGDPRVVLRFQESKVKLKVLQAKLHRDLLLAYVDFLVFSDNIQQKPFVNFLSGSLERLDY